LTGSVAVLEQLSFARQIADHADRLGVLSSPIKFPEAAILSGLIAVVDSEGPELLLIWRHPTKVMRFISLAQLLVKQEIETTSELRAWLGVNSTRQSLLSLNGIGPKTCDYLGNLVGIDCFAVDRHIVRFAADAGVSVTDYESLKLTVSFAADLLGVRRRDFDAWIWRTTSRRAGD
jgi:hypothetical protein